MPEIDPNGVPDALRERHRWVCWAEQERNGKTTKIPKVPDGSGRNASSSDPDTWGSFSQALATASDRDRYGVGFVFADDGEYVGIDLDECFTDTGEFARWVPDIPEGEWIECSPSGGGAHIITQGSRPSWWTNVEKDTDGDEHEGIEVYDSGRFFTVTGDVLDKSAEDIGSGAFLSDFLETGYRAFEGSLPWEGNQQGETGDVSASSTSRGESDGDIDLPVHDVIGRQYETGVRFSHPIHGSSTGSNFKVDEDGETWRCWRHDTTGNGLHLVGMQNDIIDCGEWDHGGLSDATWHEILTAAEADGYIEDDDTATAGDGGTAVSTPGASETGGVEYETAPWAVLQIALDDPAIPVADDQESEDSITLRDLRASEAAYATWEVLEKTGHDHRLLGVRHGPVYGYEDGVWSRDTGDDLLRQVAVDSLGPAFTETVMSNLEQHLRRARTYAADELGAPDGTVATESGLLDLTDRDTEPLRPADLALHKLPHEFDPDADATRFKEFIEDSVDPDDREKLQEYAGYLLWHHAQPFGKALLFVGPTDSGKGTFIRILKGVIGADALASESMADLTDSRWGAAQLYGKWANLRNEITPEEVKKVERFKELTGGEDRISAEFKGEQKFEFDVTQKFVFSMNQMPEVKGADGAFWNRLLFVEFPETVPEDEQVKELDKKIIESEAPGVLNWMLEGLNRLLGEGRFTNQRTTDEKKELCNAFGGAFDRFIRDAVEITGDDDDAVVKKDLHQLAQAFADYNDMEPDWNAQRGFTRMLKSQQGIGDMRTRHLGGDNDRDDVYLGIKPLPHVIEELDADVKHGSIFSSDSQQDTLD